MLFGSYDSVQISLAYGTKHFFKGTYGETLDFHSKHEQQQHGRVLMANLLQKLIF